MTEDGELARALDGAPLHEALDVSPADRAAVRRQAEAFYLSGKWAACVAALEVLATLGDVRPLDALVRTKCHAALGEDDLALRWREVAQQTLASLDATLGQEVST